MFLEEWEAWHEAHERHRARPHGFLAVTGLHWLTSTPQRFDDAPGEWTGEGGTVTVTFDDGHTQRFEGVDGAGIRERIGDTVLEIARRGDDLILRPRHPGNPLRQNYQGTPTYAPDEKWQIRALFVADPHPVTTDTVVDGLHQLYEAPGRAEFTLDGTPLSLTLFNGDEPGEFTILFKDKTPAPVRELEVAPPAADGTVLLDFNRATNMPCAYTEFATCSLPPPENRLPVVIEAGERYPRH